MLRDLLRLFLALLSIVDSRAFAGPNVTKRFAPREAGPLSVVFIEETLIDADPSTIWGIIVDLNAYDKWNPWIIRAQGRMEKGGLVDAEVKNGESIIRTKHAVILAEGTSRFCWINAGWRASFVYIQRCRSLIVQDDGRVNYRVELIIDGVLSRVSQLIQGKDLHHGMIVEMQALKQRAEGLKR